MELDLTTIKRIHFVGIKGVAMASLAVYAKERGYVISGTDTSEEFPSDEVLKKASVESLVGFKAAHIAKIQPDLVIYTGAHSGKENVEVQEAIRKGIPVLPHGKALGLFMEGKRQISVAGSHGKTTTTAMVATILFYAGYDPSYAIGGGEVAGLGSSGHYGKGDWFVAEADEYVTDPGHEDTPRFLWQSPQILVVTNIDYDHPDVYDSLGDVIQAFVRLRDKVTGRGEIILCADDPNSRPLIRKGSPVALVGFGSADYEVKNIHFTQGRTFFELEAPVVAIGEFSLKVPGKHNAVNAAMAAVAANRAGMSWSDIRAGLSHFGGVKRRFEKIGEYRSTLFFDDYAHHPKEISATLAAARSWYPQRRIIAIFQPHTYSRTKALLTDFAHAFSQSDVVITTEIYASAREHETMGVTGARLAQEVAYRHRRSLYAPDAAAVERYLRDKIQDNDVVIFMGAGDIYTWGREIVKKYQIVNSKY